MEKFDLLKWKLYLKKRELLYDFGFKHGLIVPYSQKFIQNLREVYYGGVPASVILLSINLCNGRCYDRALLATFGFGDDDFQLVDADINSIALNPDYASHSGNHCFAERTTKDGRTWVYDTSVGLVFDKRLYYLIENPRITKINSKEDTISFCDYQDIKNANINKDKYVLPLVLPRIELWAQCGEEPYAQALLREIDWFKESIGYEAICAEVDSDMKAKGISRGLFIKWY